MISIFDYSTAVDFLRDSWMEKKAHNSLFTIRAWANSLGMKHHNSLHEMVAGKRKVPKAIIPKLIDSLDLSLKEGQFLELLVDVSKSKNQEELRLYQERMRALSPSARVKYFELESFRLTQDPLHFFIGELALQKHFSPNPLWIQQRIGYPVSIAEVNETLDRLLTLDILRYDVNGNLIRVNNHIHSKSDLHDQGLKNYHKAVMKLAASAIDAQDVLEREFEATAINLSTRRMSEAKATIRDFIRSFIAEYDQPASAGEEVYQLNLQFFGIQKPFTKETHS